MYRHPETGLWAHHDNDILWPKHRRDWKPLLNADLKNSVILDLGAHVGAFTKWCLDNFENSEIVAVEPDPSNIKLFRRNFSANKRVTLCEGVVGQFKSDVSLIAPEKENVTLLYLGNERSSTNHIFPTRGRRVVEVRVFDFKTILREKLPKLVKCDIEGAEFLLDWKKLPKSVQYIIIEIHQQTKAWTLEIQQKLDETIRSQKFQPLKEIKHMNLYSRNTQFVYARNR